MASFQERPRPQFAASAPTTALNPITGEEEPYFPKRSRMRRVLAGSVLVLMMVRVLPSSLPSRPFLLSCWGQLLSPVLLGPGRHLLLQKGPRVPGLQRRGQAQGPGQGVWVVRHECVWAGTPRMFPHRCGLGASFKHGGGGSWQGVPPAKGAP